MSQMLMTEVVGRSQKLLDDQKKQLRAYVDDLIEAVITDEGHVTLRRLVEIVFQGPTPWTQAEIEYIGKSRLVARRCEQLQKQKRLMATVDDGHCLAEAATNEEHRNKCERQIAVGATHVMNTVSKLDEHDIDDEELQEPLLPWVATGREQMAV